MAFACLWLTAASQAQTYYQRLKSFGTGNPTESGATPGDKVIEAGDGKLYGVTSAGGTNDMGTVFVINKNGTDYTVLHHFRGDNTDGGTPAAGLMEASNGVLYGTTSLGGVTDSTSSLGHGTVYGLNKDGSGYTILHFFTASGGDGDRPQSVLVEGNDGSLYGTTAFGGTESPQGGLSPGSVFKINQDGSNYQLIHAFTNQSQDGSNPFAGLLKGSDGALYGTARSGGTIGADQSSSYGTVFRLEQDGGNFSVLHRFTPGHGDGTDPRASLVEGPDGKLYGTTVSGGITNSTVPPIAGNGTVFKLSKDGSAYEVLHRFNTSPGAGLYPVALTRGDDNTLYGTTYNGGDQDAGVIFKLFTDGSGFTILQNIVTSDINGGSHPIYLTISGNILYALTAFDSNSPAGALYTLTTAGAGFALLRRFDAIDAGDANHIHAGLHLGSDNFFYGTSVYGGSNNAGAIFRFSYDSTAFTILHHFDDEHGGAPFTRVIEASDGAIYGTASRGGRNGSGIICKIAKDGTSYAILHEFSSGPFGAMPSTLIEGTDGNLYGTKLGVGPWAQPAVFRIAKDGGNYEEIHALTNISTGGASGGLGPPAGLALVEGSDGMLYGITPDNGASNRGMIFKLSKDGGGFEAMRSFTGVDGDGSNPLAQLTEGSDGGLYGTTAFGGSSGWGTVFRISKTGSEYEILHSFSGVGGEGGFPIAGVIEGANGTFYGATTTGGVDDQGLVYRISANGNGYSILHAFTRSSGDGTKPFGNLAKGPDGALYGTTVGGGIFNLGTVFKLFTQKPAIRMTGLDASGFHPRLSVAGGAAGEAYHIQASTDLNNPNGWATISTNMAAIDGSFDFIDTNSVAHPIRFYRGLVP